MPIQIVRNDITRMQVDAIVNAANESLLGGGGVDGAIHRAAGPELLAECRTLGGCPTGDAKATSGYNLSCKHIIHTVGPVWRGGMFGEKQLLTSCYTRSLTLAAELGCESIAFPLISSGVYGYPKDKAMNVALNAISAFLAEQDMLVYVVVFDRTPFQFSGKLAKDIRCYIDRHYVDTHTDSQRQNASRAQRAAKMLPPCEAAPCMLGAVPCDESAFIPETDAGFSETLLQLIDRTGKKDSAIYNRANVSRQLFSKIRNNPEYQPTKATAIAFAIALELDLEQTRDLIGRAGYALTRSSKFDVIIMYFIGRGIYDIMQINTTLFEFDQTLLGS